MDYRDYRAGHTISNFWFRAKNDFIAILLSKCCDRRKGLKILNLGAGTGDDLRLLNEYGSVYVVDIDKRALDLLDKKLYVEKKVADACSLPYKDNFFDLVVSFDVFEHIDNDALAFSEAKRVLKKNGYLLFSVPAFPLLFSSHDKALGHRRRYSRQSLGLLLSGFSSVEFCYWNFFLFLPTALLRLIKKNSGEDMDDIHFSGAINNLFYLVLRFENSLTRRGVSCPVGITIAGICRK
jgi:SAM-dependent methyltransferase